jgi:hypothetical protein
MPISRLYGIINSHPKKKKKKRKRTKKEKEPINQGFLK